MDILDTLQDVEQQNAEQRQRQQQEYLRVQRKFKALFSTKEGKDVLNELVKIVNNYDPIGSLTDSAMISTRLQFSHGQRNLLKQSLELSNVEIQVK